MCIIGEFLGAEVPVRECVLHVPSASLHKALSSQLVFLGAGDESVYLHTATGGPLRSFEGRDSILCGFICVSLVVGGTKDTVAYCLAFILSSLGCWNDSFMMRRVVPHYTAPPPLLPFFSPSLFRLQIYFIIEWNLMNQPFLFLFLPYPTTTSVIQKTPKLSFNNLTEPVSYLKYIYICTLYYKM